MKQYKFKYKGKWHDILCAPCGKFKGEAIADTCFGTPDEYHFRVLESSLPKLLATLRKLNIEVAEVCDKLRWRYDTFGWFESQEVVRNGKLGRYYVRLNTIMSDNEEIRVKDFEATFAPLKWEDGNAIVFDYFDTEKAAKAACQADFQKRRAR